ncbi:TlpA family protein disulfide reductase [Aurantiacibacter arachoides]|uniref:TlpA family protein disulfide reductase n=1 Tax=Aurantiacibacter arachoides TaxID=1850444 RepID=UPI0019C16FE2|nr:TlpA disulfide reductase family protein [Aurantiacibacter arachoides]GGD46729.1 hypothetical protein GCM10011411_03050 [Aurantiacibacter arachoides]
MANLRLSLIVIAPLAAGLVAGCDIRSEDAAQENAASAGASAAIGTPSLDGTLDASFAGEDMPEAMVRDPDGNELVLSELREPVLLNLWATWCAPCVHELPLLDDLAGEMAGQVRVLTISEDLQGAQVVEPFFEDRGFANLPRWMDEENVLAFTYGGGPVLPLTVLYDAQGKEVWRVIGAYDWSSEEARAAIVEGLAASPAPGTPPDTPPSAE